MIVVGAVFHPDLNLRSFGGQLSGVNGYSQRVVALRALISAENITIIKHRCTYLELTLRLNPYLASLRPRRENVANATDEDGRPDRSRLLDSSLLSC